MKEISINSLLTFGNTIINLDFLLYVFARKYCKLLNVSVMHYCFDLSENIICARYVT
jgi:hypothetical protein